MSLAGGGLFELTLCCVFLFLSFDLKLTLLDRRQLVVSVFDLSFDDSDLLGAMVLGTLQVSQLRHQTMLLLLEVELFVHARFLLVERDGDLLARTIQVDFKLRDVIELLFELGQLALEVFLVLGE